MQWRVRSGEIVLGVQGGLGNQLFQFAFATELARRGRRVLFDTVRCRGERPFELEPLVSTDDRLAPAVGYALATAVRLGIVSDQSRMRLVRQRRSGFDPTVEERLGGVIGPAYLLGYFQAERYFEPSAVRVRQAVLGMLDTMLTAQGRALAERLSADVDSVAIHVRRGDYLLAANARHGVLGGGYYDAALRRVGAREPGHRVWFSDDLDWVRSNLAAPGDLVCPPEATNRDGGEIALMAACATRVVANSSFSWWGGWLGAPSSPVHPVIAPSSWFADGHSDAGELVPREWVRL